MTTSRISLAVAAAAVAAGVASAALAQSGPRMPRDQSAARSLAANCAACHGTNGRASGGGLKLAGLDAAYFSSQMAAFKSGQRPSTVMQQLAKGYSEADIAMLADWFARQ